MEHAMALPPCQAGQQDVRMAAGAGAIDTHVSTVFFSTDRAYKFLKPIRTSFLDHRTVKSRDDAVQEELVLNRRLAPDVYLGAGTVEEGGQVTDHFVVMRRLPADRRLSALLRQGGHGDCLRQVARKVAAFHAAQRPLVRAVAIAGRDAVRQNWSDNLRDIGALDRGVLDVTLLDDVGTLAMNYLEHSESLFQRRLEEGHVRDGHGDLTAQDIFCLEDGPRIIDCLAFDARLRIGDVLLDVAFLAMDAERLAGTEAANDLWRHYREFSGEQHPASLADHYVAYRAGVRAKVSALRVEQGLPEARHDVDSYLRQARWHLQRARRRVIIVGGTPGTGKSTLALGLADELDLPLIRSDAVRKELTGRPWDERSAVAAYGGIYGSATTDATYKEVFRRAAAVLEYGSAVILDASFARESQRENARRLAAAWGAELTQVRCTVAGPTAELRIAARLATGEDPSDAHPAILEELGRRFEPWPSAIEISTDESIQHSLRTARSLIAPDADEFPSGPLPSGQAAHPRPDLS